MARGTFSTVGTEPLMETQRDENVREHEKRARE